MDDPPLRDGDYDLVNYAGWFTYGNLSIRVRPLVPPSLPSSKSTPDLCIEVYPIGHESESEIVSIIVPQPS